MLLFPNFNINIKIVTFDNVFHLIYKSYRELPKIGQDCINIITPTSAFRNWIPFYKAIYVLMCSMYIYFVTFGRNCAFNLISRVRKVSRFNLIVIYSLPRCMAISDLNTFRVSMFTLYILHLQRYALKTKIYLVRLWRRTMNWLDDMICLYLDLWKTCFSIS